MKFSDNSHPNPVRPGNRGFSLLELLLVVGVGALLLLAGLSTYRMITQDNAVNQTLSAVFATKASVKKLFASQSGYGIGSLIPSIVAANGFPSSIRLDTGTMTANHPIGGAFDVTGVAGGFSIELDSLEQGDCMKIGMAFDTQSEDDFISLQIGADTYDLSTPPTVADLQTSCANGGAPVDMIFTFR